MSASPRNLAAFALSTGSLREWAPDPDGFVDAIASDAARVYVGGIFADDAALFAYDVVSGAVDADFPAAVGEVFGLAVDSGTLYVVGGFERVGAEEHRGAMAVELASDTVLSWDPRLGRAGRVVVPSGGDLFIGGEFATVNTVARVAMASFDGAGRLTAWDLGLEGFVGALAISGDRLYLAGPFTSTEAVEHDGLARATVGGPLDAWAPDVGGRVEALAMHGSELVLGGNFHDIDTGSGPQTRQYLAVIDETGALTPFDTHPGLATAPVTSLHVDGDTLYVTGSFTEITDGSGTHARAGVADIDLATGDVRFFDPNLGGGYPHDLLVTPSEIYLVGRFTTAGPSSTARNRAAAFSTLDYSLLSWNPNASSTVRGIAYLGSRETLLGGSFTTIGGVDVDRTAFALAGLGVTRDTAVDVPPGEGGAYLLEDLGDPRLGRNLISARVMSVSGRVRAGFTILSANGL